MKLLSWTISGFTMMELIIVIIIVTILGKLLLVRMPSDMLNLNPQAEAVARDISYTQSLAMTHGQRYCFKQTSSTTYQITNVSDTVSINPTSGGTTVTLKTPITFGTFTNLPNNLVVFDGQGIPYIDTINTTCAGATAALASNATLPLSAGARTCTITLTQQTGRISIVCN